MNRYSFRFVHLFSGMPNAEEWTDEKQNRLEEDLKKISIQTLGETSLDAEVKAMKEFREIIKRKANVEKSNRDHMSLELFHIEELA